MIIRRMRASFGKLHGELELHEGMNLLTLPNEAGKSTWSAFVLAVLYGIDTSERATKLNALPAKERYRPWDGAPMEGSIELSWDGRNITIERTSKGRTPMGVFRAYETESGQPVRELTAENCGEVLCGAERSVFERTAFIRQLGLAVSEDKTLEKRLAALVTTGEDDGKTAMELEKELKNLKNKLSGRAGRLPQLQQRAETLRAALDEADVLRETRLKLIAELDHATAEQDRLTALSKRIESARNAEKRAALIASERQTEELRAQYQKAEQTARKLPNEPTLHALLRQLSEADFALQSAQIEAAFFTPVVKPPVNDPYFSGSNLEAAKRRAAGQLADHRAQQAQVEAQLAATKRSLILMSILVGLFLAAAVLFITILDPAAVSLAGFPLVPLVSVFLNLRKRRRLQARAKELEEALLRCQKENNDHIADLVRTQAEMHREYERKCNEAKEQKQLLSDRLIAAQEAMRELIAKVAVFAPGCTTAQSAQEAIHAALRLHSELLTQKRVLEQQTAQLASVRQMLDELPDCALDPEALSVDTAKLKYDLAAAEREVERLTEALARQNGRLDSKGDAVALQAELEQTREAIAADRQKLAALELAAEALRSADETLRARFSPQITAEAGRLLAELTGEKYATLLLSPDLRLSVREADGLVMRPAAAMSCGTADQMYLALRLAMCRRLLPNDAPLVLDDTLVNFDDARTASALRLLEKEAKNRQIILFSCRKLPTEVV